MEVIEHGADVKSELSHFPRDAAYVFGFDDSNGKPSEPGDVLRAIAFAYPASIFIIVPIKDVVAAILNAPMLSIGGENALWVGVPW